MTEAAPPPGAAFALFGQLALVAAAALNRRRGRLAQLVRASRLHREGREFESLAAYHPSRLTRFGWASRSGQRERCLAQVAKQRRRTGRLNRLQSPIQEILRWIRLPATTRTP